MRKTNLSSLPTSKSLPSSPTNPKPGYPNQKESITPYSVKPKKIGWYSVSLDGGKSFQPVFGNSNLVVPEGAELIIKANDIFGDPFTFYVNGEAVTPDEDGYIRVTVKGFMLVGALGIPVIAPDVEESLNFFQKLIKALEDFFNWILSWFK